MSLFAKENTDDLERREALREEVTQQFIDEIRLSHRWTTDQSCLGQYSSRLPIVYSSQSWTLSTITARRRWSERRAMPVGHSFARVKSTQPKLGLSSPTGEFLYRNSPDASHSQKEWCYLCCFCLFSLFFSLALSHTLLSQARTLRLSKLRRYRSSKKRSVYVHKEGEGGSKPFIEETNRNY